MDCFSNLQTDGNPENEIWPYIIAQEAWKPMNLNFTFQGCQILAIRVAISQKGLVELFSNWCHLILQSPKIWKNYPDVLGTQWENFSNPGTMCPANVLFVTYLSWDSTLAPLRTTLPSLPLPPACHCCRPPSISGAHLLRPSATCPSLPPSLTRSPPSSRLDPHF